VLDFLMIAAGFLLLFLGGEGLLRGAVSLARHFGLSNFLVSAVIMGFGTSMPEMTVSVNAVLMNSPEIALGNVVGSNIANILLIIGVSAIIFPLSPGKKIIHFDINALICASLLLCGLAWLGNINFLSGILMFTLLFAYVGWSYYSDRKIGRTEVKHIEQDVGVEKPLSKLWAFVFCMVGLALLISGAALLVDGAVSLARKIGIAEEIVGLSIVAIGSSLPELAIAVVASMRKHGDVILGNVLGSNIFNILGILGVAAMLKTIPISEHIFSVDIWIMLSATVFFIYFLAARKRIGRTIGLGMFTVYGVYVAVMYL
jgi:cation:H+ antiporter